MSTAEELDVAAAPATAGDDGEGPVALAAAADVSLAGGGDAVGSGEPVSAIGGGETVGNGEPATAAGGGEAVGCVGCGELTAPASGACDRRIGEATSDAATRAAFLATDAAVCMDTAACAERAAAAAAAACTSALPRTRGTSSGTISISADVFVTTSGKMRMQQKITGEKVAQRTSEALTRVFCRARSMPFDSMSDDVKKDTPVMARIVR